MSSSFIVSISPGMEGNWQICREHKLWGVRGRGTTWRAVSARVEKGDELFVWRSGRSNGFIARVVARDIAIFAEEPGFRSPWIATRDFGAVIPFKLKNELRVPVKESFATPGRIGAKFGFNNALLQHGIGQILPESARKIREAIADGP